LIIKHNLYIFKYSFFLFILFLFIIEISHLYHLGIVGIIIFVRFIFFSKKTFKKYKNEYILFGNDFIEINRFNDSMDLEKINLFNAHYLIDKNKLTIFNDNNEVILYDFNVKNLL